MKADKFVLKITIEALSSDCFYAQVCTVNAQIQNENFSGKLVAADGDTIEWTTEKIPVEF